MNPDTSPAAKLKELIAEHGQQLVYDPDKTQQLLQEACPNNQAEVQALVTAQRLSVPWELLNAGPAPEEAKVNDLLRSLEEGGPMSADAARWILQTWASVLDIPLPTPSAAPTPVQPIQPDQTAAAALTQQAAAGETVDQTAATEGAANGAGVPSYFIIDGANRYGPADVATLNQWATEGRVHGNMRFEEQGTGRVLYAHEVPGLMLPGAAAPQTGPQGPQMRPEQPFAGGPGPGQGPYMNPPGPGGYYRGAGYGPVDPALAKSATNALVKSIICIFCCCIFGIIGIIYALQGRTKLDQGQIEAARSQINTANTISNIGLGLGIVVWIIRIILVATSLSSGGHTTTF